jgi:SsrA-binding protein
MEYLRKFEPGTLATAAFKSNPNDRERALPGTFGYTAAMSKAKKKSDGGSTIALNKKAGHDYHIEERYEAGIALLGWEVKALRAGRVQLKESYVKILHAEAFLVGAHVSPLPTASTHVDPNPVRNRKLLLQRTQLNKLIGLTERAGYTLVPTAMYWKQGRAKLEVGLAKGKKLHDKRADEKDKDWQREKQRIFKQR